MMYNIGDVVTVRGVAGRAYTAKIDWVGIDGLVYRVTPTNKDEWPGWVLAKNIEGVTSRRVPPPPRRATPQGFGPR